MLRLLAYFSTIGLEFLNAWMLWTGSLTGLKLAGWILIHGLCSTLIAWTLLSLIPHYYQKPQVLGWLFLFTISFFMPLIGPLGLTIVLVPALIYSQRTQASKPAIWQHATKPPLPQIHSTIDLDRPEAWIAGVLQHSTNIDKRLMAVLATTRLPNGEAVPLLRLALQDIEDDVRLLAYALLDRKEGTISHHIDLKEQQLQDAAINQQAGLHQGIAYDCWELVQLQLAPSEIEVHLLRKAQEHIEAALAHLPNHAGLYFLRGQIFLHQRNLDIAAAAFQKAEQLGIGHNQIIPYLAEIYFWHRDFSQLYQQLDSLVHLSIAEPNRISTTPILSNCSVSPSTGLRIDGFPLHEEHAHA